MLPKICVSIAEKSVPPDVDFAEIRLDMMDVTVEDVADIFAAPIPLIATCRPEKYDDDTRKELLITAIRHGAKFVDIEVDAEEQYRNDIIAAAKKYGTTVIISFHDEEKTPTQKTLEDIVSQCFECGADIANVACNISSRDDSEILLSLMKDDKKIISVAMGEQALSSRAEALRRGSLFTYAALAPGKETAPGQPDIKTLQRYMTKCFAVVGNPVFHSISPTIFDAAFKENNHNATYTRITADDVIDIIALVKRHDIAGFNVTSPFKEAIIPYLDELDDTAQYVGAVNTVVVKDKKLIGYNTDIKGVTETLKSHKISPKKAVVLGGGGAAAAAAYAMTTTAEDTVVINRTPYKAQKIAQKFGCRTAPLENIAEELRNADILISCITAQHNPIPPSALHKDLVVFDANYKTSPLATIARQQGCTTIDGIQWLINQAIPTCELFLDGKAPRQAMEKALSKKDNKKHVAIIGFMGAGKTTIAQELAKMMKIIAIDVDDIIEKETAKTIAKIFSEEGEKSFREKEKLQLEKVCSQKQPHIISCGGGIILDENNSELLKKHCITIFLSASQETIKERIKNDTSRPLYNEKTAGNILVARNKYYTTTADIVIMTDNKTPQQVAAHAFDEINTSLIHRW